MIKDPSSAALSFEFKLKTCCLIAKSMLNLSKLGIFHGHLTSKNILLTNEFFPKVSGLLFLDLKKYISLQSGYSNKSAYSAPEILVEENVLINVSPKICHDIYSLGIIFWEVLTGKSPFPNLKIKEVKRMVVEETLRPKVDEAIPFFIANLIRCCWQKDPLKRPGYEEIIECLEKHLFCNKNLSEDLLNKDDSQFN